jgi:hypothetical protein
MIALSTYSLQVILYQSVEDGSIALKADDDVYDDKGYYKDSHTDAEILSGVSFKMRWVNMFSFSSKSRMMLWARRSDYNEEISWAFLFVIACASESV